jgi:hypothetical protein
MKRMGCVVALFLSGGLAGTAQTNSPPIKGMASTVGLYVYPKNSQSATQQLTDESQCYTNAKSQTGYDPNATTTAAAPKKQDRMTATTTIWRRAPLAELLSPVLREATRQPGHAEGRSWVESRKSIRRSKRPSRLKNRLTQPKRPPSRSTTLSALCRPAWTLGAIRSNNSSGGGAQPSLCNSFDRKQEI